MDRVSDRKKLCFVQTETLPDVQRSKQGHESMFAQVLYRRFNLLEAVHMSGGIKQKISCIPTRKELIHLRRRFEEFVVFVRFLKFKFSSATAIAIGELVGHCRCGIELASAIFSSFQVRLFHGRYKLRGAEPLLCLRCEAKESSECTANCLGPAGQSSIAFA